MTQHQKNGKISVQDLAGPTLGAGGILVRNHASVISPGTERTSIETAQATLAGKARLRPDLVKQVLANVRREGVMSTYRKVMNRLDTYKELGYSSAGVVLESAVAEFKPGDRVACAGDAHHAEIVAVPKHLAARIPEKVDFSSAAFTTLGAIALQGVRQSKVRIGENVAVIGLGLIGLITVQLLKATGCRVIGLDIATANFPLARKLGCDQCVRSTHDAAKKIETFTNGYGTDAVIITAGTLSNAPVELACQFARKRSTVVVVGAVGMNIPRSPFYEKELTLTIACSYGPGRYDNAYEYDGIDYPVGHVRWTENRNMDAVLHLMSTGKLNVGALITHRFPIQRGLEAYELITGKRKEHSVGILLEYPGPDTPARQKTRVTPERDSFREPRKQGSNPGVGFIGAGNFAQSYLLPPLRKSGIALRGVAVTTPVHANVVREKFGFAYGTTDAGEVLADKSVEAVFIATRHDSHAPLVVQALKAGKHVFVEKPLAVNVKELKEVEAAFRSAGGKLSLLVGFNRRFSPPLVELKERFGDASSPLIMTYRANVGELPPNHWIFERRQGGRIVGEAGHFIDAMSFLSDASPVRVYADAARAASTLPGARENVSVTIRFSNGAIGHLLYYCTGDPATGKETLEVAGGGMSASMRDFREVVLWRGGKKRRSVYDGRKGHAEEIEHFLGMVRGTVHPSMKFQSILETTSATLAIGESLRTGAPVDL